MSGVVNKAIEAFVCQRYGDKLWADLLIDLSLPGYEFEELGRIWQIHNPVYDERHGLFGKPAMAAQRFF